MLLHNTDGLFQTSCIRICGSETWSSALLFFFWFPGYCNVWLGLRTTVLAKVVCALQNPASCHSASLTSAQNYPLHVLLLKRKNWAGAVSLIPLGLQSTPPPPPPRPFLARWQAFCLRLQLRGSFSECPSPSCDLAAVVGCFCPGICVYPGERGRRKATPMSAGVMSALRGIKVLHSHSLTPLFPIDFMVE